MRKLTPDFLALGFSVLLVLQSPNPVTPSSASSSSSAAAAAAAAIGGDLIGPQTDGSQLKGSLNARPLKKFRSLKGILRHAQRPSRKVPVSEDGSKEFKVMVTEKPYVIKDVCDRYDVDGCSIPLHLPFFFKTQFTPSCDRHDICYHCGVLYGISRLTCDLTFKANMDKSCLSMNGYLATAWNGVTSGKRSMEESKSHRQTTLRLIEDKAPFLKDLVDKALDEVKRDVGGAFRLLTSPNVIKAVHKKVIVDWLILLSQILHQNKVNEDGNSQNCSRKSGGKKHYSLEINKESHSQSYPNVIKFEIDASDDRLPNQTMAKPDQRSGDQSSSRDLPGNGLVKDADDRPKQSCAGVLHEADQKSMTSYRYRVSDLMDCQDVDQLECFFFADVYFEAVRIFANSSYRIPPESYCREGFVKACLPLS